MYKHFSRFMNRMANREADRQADRQERHKENHQKKSFPENENYYSSPEILKDDFEKKELIFGEILNDVGDGYDINIVKYNTIAFCPHSEMDSESIRIKDTADSQGRPRTFYFIVLNIEGFRAIVSRKLAISAYKNKYRERFR